MTQRWRIEPETASWNHESSSERNDLYLSYAAQTRSPMIKNIHAAAEIKVRRAFSRIQEQEKTLR
jgi:hypothetical protein